MARPKADLRRKSNLKTRKQKQQSRGTYTKYDDKQIMNAMKFIRRGTSYREAEKKTNVAKSTIKNIWQQYQVNIIRRVEKKLGIQDLRWKYV